VLGLIRFLVLTGLLVSALVLVAVPLVAAPLIEQKIRDFGLQSDQLTVSIDIFDPSLLTGHARQLRVQATNVDLAPATVGSLDLTFGQVSLIDRTFETVRGEMIYVSLRAGGLALAVDSVRVDGPSGAANATARMTNQQTRQLIGEAARREGISVDGVSLTGGRLELRNGPIKLRAGVAVQGGALVLTPAEGPAVVLLQPAPSDPWRLSEAWLSDGGLNVRGVIDANRLAQRLGG
jgi:hypothetical protein